MKIKILANPLSNFGKGKKKWKIWKNILIKKKVNFAVYQSSLVTKLMEFASSLHGIIVAAGGDGTINAIINGIIKSNDKNKSLGVLYSGTSPDFCKFHSIPVSPDKAVNTLLAGKIKKIDLVKITYFNGTSKHINYFSCSSNIGVGADVARFANKWRKTLGDKLGTAFGVMKVIFAHKTFDASIDIDDKQYIFEIVNHIIIIKNPYIASGLKINIDITPNDGKMFIVVIYGKTRFQLLKILLQFYSGNVIKNKAIFIKECQKASISTKKNQEIEFDGDPYFFADTFNFEICREALSLIC